jgi:L-ribulose-5-phosphate 4-epimerase
MKPYQTIREQAYECNCQIPQLGLAIYTFGNVSAFDAGLGLFAIKPSGVAYKELTPESMVVLDSDTPTHTVLYRAFPGIGGIVHTHSTHAVAWAQAQRPIPIYGTTHADHLAVEIPCTAVMGDDEIQGDYETETGNQIIKAFQGLSHREVEMVLVACHGPFTWGKTPQSALYNSAVLEEIAKMALLTERIDPKVRPLKETLIDKHYQRKHGAGAYYGQKPSQ